VARRALLWLHDENQDDSPDRIRLREASQFWSRQARTLIGWNIAESPMRFPIIARRLNFLGRHNQPPA